MVGRTNINLDMGLVDRAAAAAESADVTLLHYDEEYDRIAAITGQPTRWLAPERSLR